jgi:hypothetical protein
MIIECFCGCGRLLEDRGKDVLRILSGQKRTGFVNLIAIIPILLVLTIPTGAIAIVNAQTIPGFSNPTIKQGTVFCMPVRLPSLVWYQWCIW